MVTLDATRLLKRLTETGYVREIPGMKEDDAPSMTIKLDDLQPEEQQEVLVFLKKIGALPFKMPLGLTKELLPSLAKELNFKELSLQKIFETLATKLGRPYEEIYNLLGLNEVEVTKLQNLLVARPMAEAMKDGCIVLKKLAACLNFDETDIRGILYHSLPVPGPIECCYSPEDIHASSKSIDRLKIESSNEKATRVLVEKIMSHYPES